MFLRYYAEPVISIPIFPRLQLLKILQKMCIRDRKYPSSIAFVQDYDMHVGAMLTRGCDVWLNTPLRPLEASGTSGMKAAMNGVLNLSILDGWWPEGCINGVNGWQIGDGTQGEGEEQNDRDRDSLYKTLFDPVSYTHLIVRLYDRWAKKSNFFAFFADFL